MIAALKRILATAIGPKRVGILEWYLRPNARNVWGGPLNGSRFRQQAVEEMIRMCNICAIVETGTYRGDTTEYFADMGLPVVTAEISPRYFAYSQCRLKRFPNVEIYYGDSRKALTNLAGRQHCIHERVLFYLDAHWYADLPLADEVKFIYETWPLAVVMIDDFKVSDDAGYQYDTSPGGEHLSLEYLYFLNSLHLSMFFPTLSSVDEVPPKRGWVVLAQNPGLIELLSSSTKLRRWLSPDL
jgi:hypothetical protein